ncbi:MAG: hypothetical protein A2W91_17790 [Bacteroidetes bacterium GWF2_38_335]|nr:MAG: hypothetical protein A2W91_17790 [Bacteroidetes bacterium GWF2_38_335]OFY78013.1 MAG: hypothetical protein A2281_18670 [Bacteroidetes bacterium RIFOXYA12_FULL_38_20]HBS88285.1 hypothetical protein [Bacteroidales bacterium]
MKIIPVIFLLLIIAFSGCRNDEDFESSMNATAEGSEWCTITRIAELDQNNHFIITGTSEDEKVIILTVYGDEEDTYTLFADSTKVEFSATFVRNIEENPEEVYTATSGEVIITKHKKREHRISGSFHFNATAPEGNISITNGEFENLKYTTGE